MVGEHEGRWMSSDDGSRAKFEELSRDLRADAIARPRGGTSSWKLARGLEGQTAPE
jgi:hypothetical protein